MRSGPRRPGGWTWLSAWLPVLFLEASVLYVSSRPNLHFSGAGIPSLDKVAHFVEYAALGALVYRALRLSGAARSTSLVVTVLVVALLGLGDELFQRGVPGRVSSRLDWVADVSGGVAAILGMRALERRWPGRWGLPGEVETRRGAA